MQCCMPASSLGPSAPFCIMPTGSTCCGDAFCVAGESCCGGGGGGGGFCCPAVRSCLRPYFQLPFFRFPHPFYICRDEQTPSNPLQPTEHHLQPQPQPSPRLRPRLLPPRRHLHRSRNLPRPLLIRLLSGIDFPSSSAAMLSGRDAILSGFRAERIRLLCRFHNDHRKDVVVVVYFYRTGYECRGHG